MAAGKNSRTNFDAGDVDSYGAFVFMRLALDTRLFANGTVALGVRNFNDVFISNDGRDRQERTVAAVNKYS